MKKSKKLICILLALGMIIGLLSACDTGSKATPTPTKSSSTPTPTGVAPDDDKDDLGYWNTDGSIKLPLVSDTEKVTFWQIYSSTVYASMNDYKTWDYVREYTGVQLDFINTSGTSATEVFNLMIASNDFTDVIVRADLYVGGGDKAVDDGNYMRLNDLVESVMPNYQAMRQSNAERERDTISDAGNMWALYGLTEDREAPWTGIYIRSDYLDNLGLDSPVTIDDWYNTLTAIKSEYNTKAPLSMPFEGYYYRSEFMSAYGVGNGFYQIDGKAYFGLTEPGAKDYLTTMQKWYAEKLIDQDFLSRTTNPTYQVPTDPLANNEIIAGAFLWGFGGNNLYQRGISSDPNIYFKGVKPAVLNKGDVTHFGFESKLTKTAYAVTTQAKNPELICRLVDWFFTEEGHMLMNYGKQGEQWEYDANGNVKMTAAFDAEVANNTGKINNPWESTLRNYSWFDNDGPGWYEYTKLWLQYVDDEVLRNTSFIWAEADTSYEMPAITLTAEEGSEYSKLMTDINTYLQENYVRIITGAQEVSSFDSIVSQVKTMGIDRALELQQNALDRYYAR